MAISTKLSICLNVNGWNIPIIRHGLDEWVKKKKNKTYINIAYKRITSGMETNANWKWGNEKRYSLQMEMKSKPG